MPLVLPGLTGGTFSSGTFAARRLRSEKAARLRKDAQFSSGATERGAMHHRAACLAPKKPRPLRAVACAVTEFHFSLETTHAYANAGGGGLLWIARDNERTSEAQTRACRRRRLYKGLEQ